MEPRWTIYSHMHIESGRRYIGLTKLTMLRRWNQHLQNAKRKAGKGCRHFWNALRSYGPQAFSHEVLEVVESLEEANLREDFWIERFDTRNLEKGFNLARGGRHTPHPVQKLGDRPEFIAKCRTNSAHLLTPEGRAKSRAAVQTPEFRAKIGAIARAAAARPGSKERRSAASKEVTSRPEVLARISAVAKKKKTHCKYGHSFDGARIRSDGAQVCRTCAARRQVESSLRRKGRRKSSGES